MNRTHILIISSILALGLLALGVWERIFHEQLLRRFRERYPWEVNRRIPGVGSRFHSVAKARYWLSEEPENFLLMQDDRELLAMRNQWVKLYWAGLFSVPLSFAGLFVLHISGLLR